jgi:hypothetical protein
MGMPSLSDIVYTILKFLRREVENIICCLVIALALGIMIYGSFWAISELMSIEKGEGRFAGSHFITYH